MKDSAIVAIKTEDGRISSFKIRSNADYNGAGRRLHNCYKRKSEVQELLSLIKGDIWELERMISDCELVPLGSAVKYVEMEDVLQMDFVYFWNGEQWYVQSKCGSIMDTEMDRLCSMLRRMDLI